MRQASARGPTLALAVRRWELERRKLAAGYARAARVLPPSIVVSNLDANHFTRGRGPIDSPGQSDTGVPVLRLILIFVFHVQLAEEEPYPELRTSSRRCLRNPALFGAPVRIRLRAPECRTPFLPSCGHAGFKAGTRLIRGFPSVEL